MFGDASAASTTDAEAIERMSTAERAVTFHFAAYAAIVAAGPVRQFHPDHRHFHFFIMTVGLPDPVVGQVMPGSLAEAGLYRDRITGSTRIMSIVSMTSPILLSTNLGTPVTLLVERKDKELSIVLTPKKRKTTMGWAIKLSIR